jgi:hypothetical protein
MHRSKRVLCLLSIAMVAFAQGDRGTITGTISDPAGAVVANAPIEARNIETGAVYPAASTSTGNYTLSQLPFGSYELTVNVPGFKRYVRQGLAVQVAQTLRIDVNLEVGAATESITVNEAAPLLKTESGELSHNVAVDRLNTLPILGIGAGQAGSAGIRNPYAVTQMIPGTYWVANSIVRVNGSPNNTQSFRIEGQDASNGFTPGVPAQLQPSVDSIQEFAIQTSNFAAEYGQVGGGFFNVTMRSGNNQLHGSAYDYFVNEFLNAGTPFTIDPRGKGLIRPVQRRNDYGFTVGGPVYLPKIYDGHDKTFFFFNFEQYREFSNINNTPQTIPTTAYRNGDFSAARLTRTLANDPLGRPIIEGTIYDPATERLAPNGQLIRDPFANNFIPAAQRDPVAVKVQALIPQPTSSGLINNFLPSYQSDRVTGIPAFKIDQQIGSRSKLSFYWSRTSTASQYSPTLGASDGLPTPITTALGSFITSRLYRVNYEQTLSPTLLLHFGGGFQDVDFDDHAPISFYDAEKELGLKGQTTTRMFPSFQNMTNAQGGMKNMGPASNRNLFYAKPTANASLTWVRNNHTYKTGAEFRIEAYPGTLYTATNGIYQFSAVQTGLPSTNGQNLQGGSVGFPYASFLMGRVDQGQLSQPIASRPVKTQWGLFVQDTWKVTRRFTLDYGARWDYSGYIKDDRGRWANFSPTVSNPSAGGQPGAVIFEGDGPGRCNCAFAQNYPYAVAPRLGAAYQINPKTVLRAGWGIVYSGTADSNGSVSRISVANPFQSPAFGQEAMILAQGPRVPATPWPNYDPGQLPLKGALTPPVIAIDQNAGRPARQYQWSIGVQREVTRDLAIEVSYVANRGVWWNAPALIDLNALTPERLRLYGLDINNANDRTLLQSPVNSTIASSRGFAKPPYSGFPVASTVAQALRPFPQFTSFVTMWSPLGKTWYDSLQLKVTQRQWHGLSYTSAFSFQKELTMGAESNVIPGTTGSGVVNDVFNRSINKYISQFNRPIVFNIAINYETPRLAGNKILSWTVRDWTVGTFLQYGSGLPIQAPAAQNQLASHLFRGTFANRVPGVPLFTQDLNCHCFDPQREFVLNPNAWVQPGGGQFGSSAAYYNDYRFQRRPVENFNIGRSFRFREKISLNVRAEFTNILNRTQIPNPTVTNSQALQTRNSQGQTTAGFGFINTTPATNPPVPRQGVIVARITF